jgi:hypothetical protein
LAFFASNSNALMDMENIVNFKDVEKALLEIRGQRVLLDKDVAKLYGVETKRVNEAVKNNPDKFPDGYILALNREEWELSLRSSFSTLETAGRGEHTKYPPKAFTEKGLYMLATILKSPKATQTTIAIIETFAKIKELSRTVSRISESDDEQEQKGLIRHGGEILSDLLYQEVPVSDTETSIELNFAVLKLKHTVKRKK